MLLRSSKKLNNIINTLTNFNPLRPVGSIRFQNYSPCKYNLKQRRNNCLFPSTTPLAISPRIVKVVQLTAKVGKFYRGHLE